MIKLLLASLVAVGLIGGSQAQTGSIAIPMNTNTEIVSKNPPSRTSSTQESQHDLPADVEADEGTPTGCSGICP